MAIFSPKARRMIELAVAGLPDNFHREQWFAWSPRYCCKPPLLPARLQAALMAPATPLTPPPALAQEMNNYPRRFAGVSLLAFLRSRLSHRRRPCSTAWLTFVEKPFTAANRAGSSRTAIIFF
jgi:hypothetical protein